MILYCVCMYYCIILYMYVLLYCIVYICMCIYCMYVYVCSSVEEQLCRTLELKITNQSINQSYAYMYELAMYVYTHAYIGMQCYLRSYQCYVQGVS